MLTRPGWASIVRMSWWRGIPDEHSRTGWRWTRTRARVETKAKSTRGKDLVRPREWRHRSGGGVRGHRRGRRGRDCRVCRKGATRFDHCGPRTAAGEWADGCIPAAELAHRRAFAKSGATRRQQDFLERVFGAATHSHRKNVRRL